MLASPGECSSPPGRSEKTQKFGLETCIT